MFFTIFPFYFQFAFDEKVMKRKKVTETKEELLKDMVREAWLRDIARELEEELYLHEIEEEAKKHAKLERAKTYKEHLTIFQQWVQFLNHATKEKKIDIGALPPTQLRLFLLSLITDFCPLHQYSKKEAYRLLDRCSGETIKKYLATHSKKESDTTLRTLVLAAVLNAVAILSLEEACSLDSEEISVPLINLLNEKGKTAQIVQDIRKKQSELAFHYSCTI